jgi:hypothetical protein
MKKFLIVFGIAFFVLPVFSSAQDQDYTVMGNTDEANNNTHSVVPEGMEEVNVRGHNMLVPEGAKIELNGTQLMVESTAQYMSRRFEDIDMRLKKAEETSQDMSRKFEEIEMRLKKIEQKLKEKDK